MTEVNQLNQTISRRNVIRFLAGVPALPLATGSVATLLTGCGSDSEVIAHQRSTLVRHHLNQFVRDTT
jgi:hypothetical protein